jgi:hypothetical protein
MSSDMSEFLDIRVGDVKMPTVLETGVYRLMLTKYGFDRQANDKRTPYVLATFKAVDVIDCEAEVDLDSARNVSSKFWRTENADKITVDFFARKLGHNVSEDDTFGELWEQSIGCEVLGEVKQSISEKTGNPYCEIIRFLKVGNEEAAIAAANA